MSVTINGDTGVSKVQDGVVVQADLATGVAGTGPAFSAFQSAGTVLSNGVATKVACNTEVFDTNSNYNAATYVFQPTVAGYYQVQAATTSSGTLVGGFIVPIIYKNGVNYREGVASTTSGRTITAALIYLNGSSDYVELYVYNGSGASVTLAQPSKDTAFDAFLARSAT